MTAPKDTWTVLGILRWTTDYFRDRGVSEPRASAEVLLAHTLNLSRLDLYLRFDQPLNPDELARFKSLVLRRRQGEPVAYLTGHREFWSLDLRVTPAVLIPRPETETLVAGALEAMRREPQSQEVAALENPAPPLLPADAPQTGAPGSPSTQTPTVLPPSGWGLEVGVGSGAVIIALARELPQMNWVGVDLSGAALAVARDNARRHGVAPRVHLFRADLLEALKPAASFALVVANLPYVPAEEWERLPREIKEFEPATALKAGEDGLMVMRPFIRQAHERLRPRGWLLLEVGDHQAPMVTTLLEETGAYDRVDIIEDFHGMARVVRARRRSRSA
jgi:release factor glutamine methyltransferase